MTEFLTPEGFGGTAKADGISPPPPVGPFILLQHQKLGFSRDHYASHFSLLYDGWFVFATFDIRVVSLSLRVKRSYTPLKLDFSYAWNLAVCMALRWEVKDSHVDTQANRKKGDQKSVFLWPVWLDTWGKQKGTRLVLSPPPPTMACPSFVTQGRNLEGVSGSPFSYPSIKVLLASFPSLISNLSTCPRWASSFPLLPFVSTINYLANDGTTLTSALPAMTVQPLYLSQAHFTT